MKNMILKLNYWLFYWYYKRVDKHFHQWTFFKSIKLLIQNYEHCLFRERQNEALISDAIKREEQLTSALNRIRMQQIAGDDQINSINKMFGTDFNKSTDN